MGEHEGHVVVAPERIWTAALVIIGNEILSGRTQDKNLGFVARWLNGQGIALDEVRVVPDRPEAIGKAVLACMEAHDYVFTTGGIGPTHDDITVDSVAQALGLPVVFHPKAEADLREYYGERITDARLRMARVPEGAELLENPETVAPGIRMGNLFLMAGVPSIMQGMLRGLEGQLQGGRPVQSMALGAWVQESMVADLLAQTEADHPGVQIGSYPFWREGRGGANFVLRSADSAALQQAKEALRTRLADRGIPAEEGEI